MNAENKRTDDPIYKEETATVPEICQRCGNWKPQFYRLIGLDCAVYKKIPKGTDDRCGARSKRCTPPQFS